MVHELRRADRIGSVVVLHIGDNGFFRASCFDRIMTELEGASRVLVVNLKVPRNWEGPNNRMLASAVTRYENASLVDWHSASKDRPELFWADGIHVRPEGARLYANLIAETLRPLLTID